MEMGRGDDGMGEMVPNVFTFLDQSPLCCWEEAPEGLAFWVLHVAGRPTNGAPTDQLSSCVLGKGDSCALYLWVDRPCFCTQSLLWPHIYILHRKHTEFSPKANMYEC